MWNVKVRCSVCGRTTLLDTAMGNGEATCCGALMTGVVYRYDIEMAIYMDNPKDFIDCEVEFKNRKNKYVFKGFNSPASYGVKGN